VRLEVVDLVRRFDDVRAVDGVSFRVAGGEIYGFVGPNGAGKTTTMRILATLDEPTAGDAFLDGVSIVQHPERARRAVGFMPDNLPSHHDMTVDDYLDFFGRAYALRGADRRRVVAGVVEFTRLGGIRGKRIDTLSKGMKQRLSLARTLIHDPGVLVLDEPAAGLDPRARVELRELLLALAADGKAILISSHILTELSEICHGAVILEHGRIVRSGTIEELLEDETLHWTVRLRALEPPEELHRRLLAAPHVEAVRPVGAELEVDLLGGPEESAELLAHLVTGGVKVVEYRRRRGGLEDAFMRFTRGDVS
jgi:ABC-2 type transport system ATP-binding protein